MSGVEVLGAPTARPHGLRGRPWRHADLSLIVATTLMALIGLTMVYFATEAKLAAHGSNPRYYLERQALFVAAGIAVMIAVARVDYRFYVNHAPVIYGATVAALAAVISPLGASSKGHQAWFGFGSFQVQPSELAKIAVIVSLAAYAASQRRSTHTVKRVFVLLVMAGIPMALIVLQPDVGTDLVFATILVTALVAGGIRARHLAMLSLAAILGVFGVVHAGFLHRYQIDRITAFVDQRGAPGGARYNLEQSEIAISSGGLTGEGLGRGTQTNRSFVPEQHTDFVFTVVGEESGFAGSALVLLLFSFIVWRVWRAARLARDSVGTLICVQMMALIVGQVFENAGMTMGIMPIAGIPLPFVSYGGSALLAYFAGMGLVISVHMHRFS